MNEKNILFIGLPGTGKTTFLAALWQLVDSHIADRSFKLINMKGDQEYLNTIREAWLSYVPVPRTLVKTGTKTAELKVVNSLTEESINLTIPDFSGEVFRLALEQRQWSEDIDKQINASTGIILFVHSKNITKPITISQAKEIEDMLMEDLLADLSTDNIPFIKEDKNDNIGDQSVETKPWSHESVPTQVKLIDLLQLVVNKRIANLPLTLSIVISAWDLIDPNNSENVSPENWTKNDLPLLYQYLTCNASIFKTNFFGISAQGGDYKIENNDELYDKPDPAERISVKVNSAYSHDISLPILWVTDQL
jgi:hypothetical protein